MWKLIPKAGRRRSVLAKKYGGSHAGIFDKRVCVSTAHTPLFSQKTRLSFSIPYQNAVSITD